MMTVYCSECYQYNNIGISRRLVLQNTAKCIGFSAILNRMPVNAAIEEENRPLTPAEMEEYKKLLIEAERIKSVIDANKKSFLKEFDEQSHSKNATTHK